MDSNAKRRKARFRAALALAEMTVGEWAKVQGVSANHVYLVLRGLRNSPRLDREIDAFCLAQLGRRRGKAAMEQQTTQPAA